MRTWKQKWAKIVVAVLVIMGMPQIVLAQTPCSTTYCSAEQFFGTGGDLDSTSASYRAKTAAGETGVGNSTSANYQANAGFNTTDAPFLEFIVNNSALNLGTLSTSTTATGTATFSVRTYLASGYSVYTKSTPPRNGGYTMAGMSSAGASVAGTEQFGINLKANTSPTTFGAEAVQVPDSSFGFGTAATGYNTVNQYKYVNGDIIATSTKSSGQTTFTISYILNISTTTAGGTYTMNHDLVAVSTY